MVIGIDASRAFVKDPAGPEYYSLRLIQNISKIDKNNQYILYLRPGQKPDFAPPKNFRVQKIKLHILWTQIGLAFAVILRPPDVLFVPAHTLPLLARIFRPRLPIVVTVHGLEGRFLPQTGLFLTHIYRNWSISWAVRLATKLIAVSRATKRDIIKNYKTRSNKIKVIHEGVDFDIFRSKKTKKCKIQGKYVLFVGTLQPRKNLIRLIEAFSKLEKTSTILVIAGKLGWMYEDILEAPKRFGVQDRIQFIGRVDDRELVDLYRGAEAFVLPSLTEGFGLPVLEAQAAGIPVIAAKSGALPEVAGKGALFVNPLSVESIRQGLVKVLQNKGLKNRLVKSGRENVKNFSWKKTAYNTINFLVEIGNK